MRIFYNNSEIIAIRPYQKFVEFVVLLICFFGCLFVPLDFAFLVVFSFNLIAQAGLFLRQGLTVLPWLS